MTGVLIRWQPWEEVNTGRMPCEDGGRDSSDAFTSQ